MPRIALDSNILNALLRQEPTAQAIARLLAERSEAAQLVVCPVVYAEVLAGRGVSVAGVHSFFDDTGILLDAELPLPVWEKAAQGFSEYAERRRQSGGGLPRRLLADFVVGAHADRTCTGLVTLDPQHYRLAFPELSVIQP